MKVSVAAFAPPMPPDTGASSAGHPRSWASACALRALSTSMVEQSMSERARFHRGKNVAPDREHVLSGRQHGDDRLRVGRRFADRAGDATPASRAASQEAAARSNPTTLWPALTRLAAIGPPMWPRPMKAMAVMRSSLLSRLAVEALLSTQRAAARYISSACRMKHKMAQARTSLFHGRRSKYRRAE